MASSRQPNFGTSNFKLLPSLRRVQSGVPKTAGGTELKRGRHDARASGGQMDTVAEAHLGSRSLCSWGWRSSARPGNSPSGRTKNRGTLKYPTDLYSSLDVAWGSSPRDYNAERPHSSLGRQTPLAFAERWPAPSA